MAIDFNNPATWLTADIHTPPSAVNIVAYQARIDAVCGLTKAGKPAILLSWMPAIENYHIRYADWDKAGFGTKKQFRGTYVYRTLYDGDDNPIDVPPPRWALKQHQSAAQYLATDDATRWQKMVVKGQNFVREMRPPHPPDGRHIPFMRIGAHNGFCCREQKELGSVCYGEYREPDEAYLEVLRRAVKIRSEETAGQNPDAPISAETLRQAALEAARYEEEKRLAAEQAVKEVVDENFGEMAAYITGDDSFKNQTAYSLPNFKRTASGLIVPQ